MADPGHHCYPVVSCPIIVWAKNPNKVLIEWQSGKMPVADLILKNANVITLDTRQPHARLVAVKGDKILSVADNESLSRVKGAKTKVIDCQGKTLVPGFNDAHCHIFSFIRKLLSIDLSPASVKSIAEVKAIISRQAQNSPLGQWLSGTDYNDFYLAEKRHPTRWDIDEVAPYHPVVLTHRSLHACVLNSLALTIAGITRETPEPAGAVIDRDHDTGEPTGLLFEMLGYIREKVMPPLSAAELIKGITLANRHYISQGITSLQEATVVNNFSRWQKFRRFKEAGQLKSRVSMMCGIEAVGEFQREGLISGSEDNQLSVGPLKMILTEATGQLYPSQAELNQVALKAHRAGWRLAIHAVQPSVVEAAITALEYAQRQLPQTDRRHRIEHCSECPPPLLRRLKKLRPVIVTQPPFLYFSGERYLATVPKEQQRWLYRIRSLLDSGLIVAGSSDSPIVSDSPLLGIYAAVTRETESGHQLLSQESISVEPALAMYTINAAYASFEEGIKGSLTPGKLADMVLLNDNPLEVSPEQIKDIKVEMTIIGGEVVWEA